MKSTDKSSFRKTKTWQNFRDNFIKHHSFCGCCGMALTKKTNVHHLYKDDYTNLDPLRFIACHAHCHNYWHTLNKIKNKSKMDPALRKKAEQFYT